MKSRPEYISIGRIIKAHGIKGEVVVVPLTDDLHQFEHLKLIALRNSQAERHFFNIERVRIDSNRILIKFDTIDDRDSAFRLKGWYIEKRTDECEKLPADQYYIFDLIGLKVKTTDNRWLGEVTDVLSLPANDVYVVHDGSKEYLIPAIKDVIKTVDLDEEYLLIEPIAGLL